MEFLRYFNSLLRVVARYNGNNDRALTTPRLSGSSSTERNSRSLTLRELYCLTVKARQRTHDFNL